METGDVYTVFCENWKKRPNTGIKGRFLFSLYKQAKLLSKCLLKVANDLVVDLAVCLQASAHMCLCANVLLGLLGKSRPEAGKA